jgi:hypothetical protein
MFKNIEMGTHNTTVPAMNQGSDVTRTSSRLPMASKRERSATNFEYGKEK